MSNYLIQGETLTNIANAIRTKTGKTDSIPTENMASEISDLPIYPLYDGAVEEINLYYRTNSSNGYSASGLGNVTTTDIIIPNTYNGKPVNIIYASGFKQTNITSLRCGSNLTTISGSAFLGCASLTSVIISDSVTDIGIAAFQNCTELSNLVLGRNVISIGTNCFQATKITNVDIPDGVQYIQTSIFAKCANLERVKFGNNVKSIYSYAFQNCTSAKLYDFRKATKIPNLDATSLLNIPTTCKIVVPDSLYDQWIVATHWPTYASQIVKASEYTEA